MALFQCSPATFVKRLLGIRKMEPEIHPKAQGLPDRANKQPSDHETTFNGFIRWSR